MASADPSRPWKAWALNAEFLACLKKWYDQESESSSPRRRLVNTLHQLSEWISSGKEALDFAPDGPVPVKSVLFALGAVIKLSIVRSSINLNHCRFYTRSQDVVIAKDRIFQFAVNVANWMDSLCDAFDQSENGAFTQATWGNLQKIRYVLGQFNHIKHSRGFRPGISLMRYAYGLIIVW
jgi:hypothetical protein